jgi:hypothetical protein
MCLCSGANSFPVLDGAAVEGIVADAVARGPLLQEDLDALPRQLGVSIDPHPVPGSNGRKNSVYNVGNLVLRDNPEEASNKLLVRADGTPLLQSTVNSMTLESSIFPYLFPNGTGPFQHMLNNPDTLASYLKWRMNSFFTAFTLFKPYLLMMYQIRQV